MLTSAWIPRALPFAIYVMFIAVAPVVETVMPKETYNIWGTAILYPIKITFVTLALVIFWKSYEELKPSRVTIENMAYAIGIGIGVFVLWIHMDWDFATMGSPDVYDPHVLPNNYVYAFMAIRLLGASVIVAIFEEIFWRSLIIRYIIHPEFTNVRIGQFTWASFVISAILFGLEHHYWLAGIVAGILYNLLLYKTRSLVCCMVSHGVTNLALGVYVITTGNWQFW